MSQRPAPDLSLYLVTDTGLCGGRDGVLATVAAAVAGGVTAVQVRDPLAPARDLVDLARALRERLAPTGVPVIVNDRAEVAAAVGADGVHIGQEDLPPMQARAIVGAEAYVGLSVHAERHVDALRYLPPGTVDYLGVGPVFAQRTKRDAAPPVGLDALAAIVARAGAVDASVQCVAIGGIDVGNATAVRATGVHGIAVVSAICGQPDPHAAAAALAPVLSRRRLRDVRSTGRADHRHQ
jgi:thiamine-phosphate pyrophosphorylase